MGKIRFMIHHPLLATLLDAPTKTTIMCTPLFPKHTRASTAHTLESTGMQASNTIQAALLSLDRSAHPLVNPSTHPLRACVTKFSTVRGHSSGNSLSWMSPCA
jgi:hypothetical protein